MSIRNTINRKLYFTLLAASTFSIVAIMPYVINIQGETLRAAPISLPLVILVSVIQSIILFAIFTFVGLKLSKKLGFQIPILENFVNGQKIEVNIKSIIKKSVLFGVLVGIAIILLDFLFTNSGINLLTQIHAPAWQGLLASFYGGISEEIVIRLFFMSFIIWIISRFSKSKTIENKTIIRSGIIISSIIFGLGHLPITGAMAEITPIVVIRAILLNGVGGVVFGWLYWKKGLESGMIAHFSADIVIHFLLPLILSVII